jgi:hypothetical protein
MPIPVMRLTRVISGSTLNAPAAHPRSDGRGYYCRLRDRRASRCDGGGHDGGFGDWRADDADPAYA